MKAKDREAIAELMSNQKATVTIDRASLELLLDAVARIEREACARRLREEANKIWAVDKRIEEAGRGGDFDLWHKVKLVASDLHDLARKLEARSEG